ncbi:hypothetical protein D3C86_1572760 [compost metagenome]
MPVSIISLKTVLAILLEIVPFSIKPIISPKPLPVTFTSVNSREFAFKYPSRSPMIQFETALASCVYCRLSSKKFANFMEAVITAAS